MKKEAKTNCGITRYPSRNPYFTTGAYIERISYPNGSGKEVFGWIVTGFEGETFQCGEPVPTDDFGLFPEALTPPEDEKDRSPEYIAKALLSNGVKEMGPGYYSVMPEEDYSTLNIRLLDDIAKAGGITRIDLTLDDFLLDCPRFSQVAREILVSVFGGWREDIFLTHEDTLIVGNEDAGFWMITEHPHKYVSPADKSRTGTPAALTPDNEEESPEETIKQLFRNYWSNEIELDTPLQSSLGSITKVTTDGVYTENGEDAIDFSMLDDDELDVLACEIEQQILEEEKAFQKSQS